jgi:hypothetical protein
MTEGIGSPNDVIDQRPKLLLRARMLRQGLFASAYAMSDSIWFLQNDLSMSV